MSTNIQITRGMNSLAHLITKSLNIYALTYHRDISFMGIMEFSISNGVPPTVPSLLVKTGLLSETADGYTGNDPSAMKSLDDVLNDVRKTFADDVDPLEIEKTNVLLHDLAALHWVITTQTHPFRAQDDEERNAAFRAFYGNDKNAEGQLLADYFIGFYDTDKKPDNETYPANFILLKNGHNTLDLITAAMAHVAATNPTLTANLPELYNEIPPPRDDLSCPVNN